MCAQPTVHSEVVCAPQPSAGYCRTRNVGDASGTSERNPRDYQRTFGVVLDMWTQDRSVTTPWPWLKQEALPKQVPEESIPYLAPL